MSENTFSCDDEMLPAAVDVILETKQTSVSMLHRRLNLGYARAARIVDEMEEKGIVGPFVGSKPRAILITRKQWELMQAGKLDEYIEYDVDNYFSPASDDNVSSAHVSPEPTPSVQKPRRKYHLSAILKESGKPKPHWAKFLFGFIFLCGVLSIMNAFVSTELPLGDRAFYLIMGLFLCLVSKLSIIRWLLISLSALCLGVISLPTVYSQSTGFNLTGLFMVFLYLSVSAFYGNKIRKRFIVAQINSISQKTMAEIDCMSGLEFEEYTAQLLTSLGYTNVVTTKASGDQGIDVLAQKNGVSYAIQCKNYSSKLGNTPVQEAYAGKSFYDCDIAVVITNSTFTPGAYELASSIGVLLWDRNVLQSMIYEAY